MNYDKITLVQMCSCILGSVVDMLYDDHNIIDFGGYPAIYMPDHPHAFKSCGLVRIHVLVMEEHLGRRLNSFECVHHIDRNKYNYDLSNLMLFRTAHDHANYHKVLDDSKLNYCLEYINGAYSCKLLGSSTQNTRRICPVCGGIKSYRSALCSLCRWKTHQPFSYGLSKSEFIDLLETHTLEDIGKMYGITGNAVKKQALRLGVYKPKFQKCPDVPTLIYKLSNDSVRQTAEYFDVSVATISTWIKNNNIVIVPETYVCVNTGYSTHKLKNAVCEYYSDQNVAYVERQIRQCCDNHDSYKGLYWTKIGKNVYVKS